MASESMTAFRKILFFSASVVIASLVAACGGGGGGGAQDAPPASQTSAPYVPPSQPVHQPWETVMMSMKLETPPYLSQMLQARTCYVPWHQSPCAVSQEVRAVDFWLKTEYQALADNRLVGSEIYSKIDLSLGASFDYRTVSIGLLFNKPAELVASPVGVSDHWGFESLYRQDIALGSESWLATGYNPNGRWNHVTVRKAADSPNTIEVELTTTTRDGTMSREYFFLYGEFVPE